MKYGKSISLFFVYPLCCFLAGFFVGLSFVKQPSVEKNVLSGIDGATNAYEGESLQKQDRQPDLQNGQLLSEEKVAEGIRTEEISEAVYGAYVISQSNVSPEMPTDGYYVKNHNNRVVVYHMDQETVFLMTEIYVSELPNDVQEKLNQGIVMTDEGSLYDFLENYTS